MRKAGVLDPGRFKFNEKPPLLTESTLSFRHWSILAPSNAVRSVGRGAGETTGVAETRGAPSLAGSEPEWYRLLRGCGVKYPQPRISLEIREEVW